MDAETHNIPRGEKKEEFFGGDQVMGSRSLYTTRSIAQIFAGVLFNVSPHLYVFSCCGVGQ
jgi:hypothetical protein